MKLNKFLQHKMNHTKWISSTEKKKEQEKKTIKKIATLKAAKISSSFFPIHISSAELFRWIPKHIQHKATNPWQLIFHRKKLLKLLAKSKFSKFPTSLYFSPRLLLLLLSSISSLLHLSLSLFRLHPQKEYPITWNQNSICFSSFLQGVLEKSVFEHSKISKLPHHSRHNRKNNPQPRKAAISLKLTNSITNDNHNSKRKLINDWEF